MSRALLVAVGGGIGDALLATPVARALASRYARVDALTVPRHRIIFERCTAIANVIDDGALFPTAARMRNARYDAAVVTWATAHAAFVPLLAQIPVRVGQTRRLYSRAFTERVDVRSEFGDHATHWSQILLDFARAVHCDTSDVQPRFELRAGDRAAAQAFLLEREAGPAFAILHPTRGISHQRATWPTAGFIKLARALRERYGVTVLVTGSRDDAETAQTIAAASGAISIAGETALPLFAALAERAALVVAMDSGPMHLAAATGAPTVGIFALRSDEPDRWAPLGARTAVVRAVYPCPGWHRKETCPDYPCVRELPLATILTRCDGLLADAVER